MPASYPLLPPRAGAGALPALGSLDLWLMRRLLEG